MHHDRIVNTPIVKYITSCDLKSLNVQSESHLVALS